MTKKSAIVLFIFQILFCLFGAAYCVYHAIEYPLQGMVYAPNRIFFYCCYYGAAACLVGALAFAITAFCCSYFHKGFGFFLAIFLLPIIAAYILTTLYCGTYTNWGVVVTELILLGFFPLLFVLLGFGLGEKMPLARAILLTLSFIFLSVVIFILFYRVFLYDYGEPYAGKGGPLHFAFCLPTLMASFGILCPSIPFLWIETIRKLRQH
jgi:hypothetical protein